MSGRRFDTKTTMFSPEGRLFQVEYAMRCIEHAATTIGVLTKEGVVLCAEKPVQSMLLDSEKFHDKDISAEKLFLIDDHLAVSVAGLTADANSLINYARASAQRYSFTYQENVPVEHLVNLLCDLKQGYTQFGSQRPFGVSFLYAGHDTHFGFQLYHSDPSGNYRAWKANAIGQHTDNAQSVLKQEWKPDMTLHEGMLLCTKVLGKCMDTSSLTTDKIEIAHLTKKDGEKPKFHILTKEELTGIVEEAAKIREEEEKQKEKERKERQQKSG